MNLIATDAFLKQFGFETLKELPGIEDIEGVLAEDDENNNLYMQQISLDLSENNK